jgi:hypothetical protein
VCSCLLRPANQQGAHAALLLILAACGIAAEEDDAIREVRARGDPQVVQEAADGVGL